MSLDKVPEYIWGAVATAILAIFGWFRSWVVVQKDVANVKERLEKVEKITSGQESDLTDLKVGQARQEAYLESIKFTLEQINNKLK